ncbi:MAG: helix-turn-helix domain-containing protein [Heliobacteriaceae bacterium]|jgi:transcriptional regulator with XRE-family HTH domain|nr:helix-turn-helix domain-containing protein [Heliobacteriaceae bacterium]
MTRISTLAQKFAIRIRFERIKKKLSQEKLAELAGIGRSTLTQIEGQTSSPTLDVVEKLAKALEYEPYELLIFNNLQI